MKFFSANIDSLHKLYINQLQGLLSAEQQITEALPKMIEQATDPQLKQAFQSHLQETEVHVTRLEEILQRAVGEAKTVKCKALSVLVNETEEYDQGRLRRIGARRRPDRGCATRRTLRDSRVWSGAPIRAHSRTSCGR